MNPVKNAINDLVLLCEKKGLRHVVISPGSRNAPIANEFIKNRSFICRSIVDERSAGFFALGMAQQLDAPVILLCTSGTAVLNYAPAIAEAFYQKIPLLVITADRPKEWIGQGESQTIDQRGIFANYIKASFDLPQNPSGENDSWYTGRMISEAINVASLPQQGPVHLNMSLDEPLYEPAESSGRTLRQIDVQHTEQKISAEGQEALGNLLKNSHKVLVLTGALKSDKKLNALLDELAQSPAVAVLTETTGNLHSDRFFPCIDQLLATVDANEQDGFRADLLITFGDQVISKRIKSFLRKHRPMHHWHVDPSQLHFDTYQSLTKSIPVTPLTFLEQMRDHRPDTGNYRELWKKKNELAEHRHREFLNQAPYSDLTVFEQILEQLPASSVLQMGNSSPVRYIQLFRNRPDIRYFGNRGTSGIEGCTSTAAGAALINKEITTLITGDLGFFYDTNGLWHRYLSPLLRIIVINNSGGGIFRFIQGPDTITDFETFIETSHNLKAELLAKLHGLNYFCAENKNTLQQQLKAFFSLENDRPSILEVNTPRLENATVLRNYFEYLNKGI